MKTSLKQLESEFQTAAFVHDSLESAGYSTSDNPLARGSCAIAKLEAKVSKLKFEREAMREEIRQTFRALDAAQAEMHKASIEFARSGKHSPSDVSSLQDAFRD